MVLVFTLYRLLPQLLPKLAIFAMQVPLPSPCFPKYGIIYSNLQISVHRDRISLAVMPAFNCEALFSTGDQKISLEQQISIPYLGDIKR